ncbi:MAG: ATP-binding protein [Calditrichia bacterium]
MQNNPGPDRLVIASDMVHLPEVEAFITSLCKKAGLNEDKSDNMAIAITEMVNNAILHGNKQDVKKMVTVDVAYFSDHVQVSIQDEGDGFNPDDVEDPLEPKNLWKQSGRGIFLVREFVHSVEFHPSEKGTKVVLTEYITPS